MKKAPELKELSKKFTQQELALFAPELSYAVGSDFGIQSQEELAHALLQKGERALVEGDTSGVHYFKLCSQIIDTNPEIFFAQGLALVEYGITFNSLKEVRLALKKFQKATQLKTDYFAAYHAWGNALHHLGKHSSTWSHFLTAKNKYKKAIAIAKDQPHDVMADLHWEYARNWEYIAKDSGEAIDLNIALQSYESAQSHQDDLPPEFWIDFGSCAQKLGHLSNDLRLFVKSIDCFKNAISLSISSHEGWYKLACAVSDLYSYTQDEDHFSQANECFSTAAKFDKANTAIWISWAQLLRDSGESVKDTKKLLASIEKAQKAALLDAKNTKASYIWADTLCKLGVLSDSLEYIHQAQNKLEGVKNKETVEHAYAEGECLLAQARYFDDIDLYYQAIERFQAALSMDRSCAHIWSALGSAYTECSAIDQEIKSLELAVKFHGKALNLRVSSKHNFNLARALFKLGEETRVEETVELALYHFESALALQNNAIYIHPEWMFDYALCLDLYGEFSETDKHYTRAIEILHQVLMVDPDFPGIHHQLGVVYGHFADLASDKDLFARAFHHFHIAQTRDRENDQIQIDWAVNIITSSQLAVTPDEMKKTLAEAQVKLVTAAQAANTQSFFYLSCLYSLLRDYDLSMHFLGKSYLAGSLPPLSDVLQEEWLDNMREVDEFKEFIFSLESAVDLGDQEL